MRNQMRRDASTLNLPNASKLANIFPREHFQTVRI
jgi:hypothetical protein